MPVDTRRLLQISLYSVYLVQECRDCKIKSKDHLKRGWIIINLFVLSASQYNKGKSRENVKLIYSKGHLEG